MKVTTQLRLSASGSIVSLFVLLSMAATALAGEVTIDGENYELNGDLVGFVGGRVVLLVHGTLAHKDMELIEGLQTVFLESGQSSDDINLSLNIDASKGFFP